MNRDEVAIKKLCNQNVQLLSSCMLLIIFLASFCLCSVDPVSLTAKASPLFSPVSRIRPGRKINYVPPDCLVENISGFPYLTDDEIKPMKFFHHNDDVSYVSQFFPADEKLMTFTAGKFNDSILHLKNVYITYSATCVTQKFEIISPGSLFSTASASEGPVIGAYDSIIAFGHAYVIVYGHWFIDFLCPLALIPDDILKSSMIIVQRSADNFVVDSLKILGRGNWIFMQD